MLDRPESTIAPLLPPARSRILRPGIRALAVGVERYTIEGGRSIVVDLGEGDRIVVRDVEGGQPCELIAFGADGRAEPQASSVWKPSDEPSTSDTRGARCDRRSPEAPQHRPLRRARDPHLRRRFARRRHAGIPRRAEGATSSSPHRPRRWIRARRIPRRRSNFVIERADAPRSRRGSPAPRPARRPAAGHPRQPRDRRGLSRARRRIHPDHRRRRAPMLRLPVLLRPQARQGPRASARRDDDAQPDRPRLSGAGPSREMLRPGHGAAGRDHPGHGRPPRRVRARLLRKILRGPGLSRSRQLHRQFQRRARSVRRRSAQGLDGAEFLLQHRHRRQ